MPRFRFFVKTGKKADRHHFVVTAYCLGVHLTSPRLVGCGKTKGTTHNDLGGGGTSKKNHKDL